MIDVARIKVKAGNGGEGHVSFRREKFITKGGPDGGDGGSGGSVYFMADNNMATLADFRAKSVFAAESGSSGKRKKMTGESGEDYYVKIPVGTLVYDIGNNKEVLIGDLNRKGETLLIAKGGVAGKGNFRFRSSVNKAPRQYTPGGKGEEKEIKLEVKLLADIGLVGAPNAGKSTLINRLTRANAKVGSYPFTTLSPNLGICALKDGQEAVIADIPGLIEGASQGKGLGDEFLRHVERTRILVHIVSPFDLAESVDYTSEISAKKLAERTVKSYEIIRKELEVYGHGLESKLEIVVVNKLDLAEVKNNFEYIKKAFKKKETEVLGVSAASGEGIEALKDKIMEMLQKIPTVSFEVSKPVKVYTIKNLPNRRMVFDDEAVLTLEDKNR